MKQIFCGLAIEKVTTSQMNSAETKNMRSRKRFENQSKPLFKKYQEILNPSIPIAQMERMIIYVAFGLVRSGAENIQISPFPFF
jgi:hypothetical protein